MMSVSCGRMGGVQDSKMAVELIAVAESDDTSLGATHEKDHELNATPYAHTCCVNTNVHKHVHTMNTYFNME